jgi:hypothetical protein
MFYFENVMELGRQRGVLCKEHPVLCKPNRKVFELILSELGQVGSASHTAAPWRLT